MAYKACINCERTLFKPCCCIKTGCCGCRGRVCVRCCITNYPMKIHEPIIENGVYVCRRCNKTFAYKCPCCTENVFDRCQTCCEAYRHPCCVQRKVIFRQPPHEPFFIGPSVLPERGEYKRLDRETSVKVLTKQLRSNPLQLTKNKFTRFAAIEIEASSIKDATQLNSIVNKWSCAVVRDSSTGTNGFEINTVPACGNALTEQLEELCSALEQGKAQTDKNCGLHVHVDCRDYGYQEVQRFIKVYNVVESTLFAAMHPSRYGNTYCQPCGPRYYRKFVQGLKPEKKVTGEHVRNVSDTKVLKKTLIPLLYGRSALEKNTYGNTPLFHNSRADHYGRVDERRNELRYSAVNLHSYFLRGTIEFRMHHAALNFKEIYGWTKFLVALMDAVNRTSNSHIQQFIRATPTELEGVKSLYDIDVNKEISAGLVVLSSLLHVKYVAHLVSKIKLMHTINKHFESLYLPAELFFNHLSKTGGDSMDIEESGLTEV